MSSKRDARTITKLNGCATWSGVPASSVAAAVLVATTTDVWSERLTSSGRPLVPTVSCLSSTYCCVTPVPKHDTEYSKEGLRHQRHANPQPPPRGFFGKQMTSSWWSSWWSSLWTTLLVALIVPMASCPGRIYSGAPLSRHGNRKRNRNPRQGKVS